MNLKDYIASIENYPQEGITFRDISPLMADGNAYSYAVREIVQYATDKKIDMIVGPEARGFIVGCPVAFELGIGFAPVRKPGKLPRCRVCLLDRVGRLERSRSDRRLRLQSFDALLI